MNMQNGLKNKLNLFFLLLISGIFIALTVSVKPLILVDAGDDRVICLGDVTTLGGNPTTTGGLTPITYEWTSNTGETIPNVPNPDVSPIETTTYFLNVIDADGFECPCDSVTVSVCALIGSNIEYKKTSEPNDTYFQQTGRVCLNDPNNINEAYTFRLNPAPVGLPLNVLQWDIWDLDFLNEIQATGIGSQINGFKFEDEGTTRVRFWCDTNGNSMFDAGENHKEVIFEVMPFNIQEVSVARATTTAPLTNANVDGILTNSTTLVHEKQHPTNDTRCCVRFTRNGGIGNWIPAPNRPDVINTAADFNNLNNNIAARVKVVRQIKWCANPAAPGVMFLGCTTTGDEDEVVVVEGTTAQTWAHELGHSVGLPHRDNNINNLMYFSSAGNETLINATECSKFED